MLGNFITMYFQYNYNNIITDHLKARLDQYAHDLNFAIKVLHLEKRSGITVARLTGAEVASGEILVFLDSHCEVVEGWLEPMVYRIAQDRYYNLLRF